jgi:hypothetical protein
MIDKKSDPIEYVVHVLGRTAGWQQGISTHFNDPRNIRAAQTLKKLAGDAAEMTDEQYLLLEDKFAWDSLPWRNAARQIGFHNRSKDFGSFSSSNYERAFDEPYGWKLGIGRQA